MDAAMYFLGMLDHTRGTSPSVDLPLIGSLTSFGLQKQHVHLTSRNGAEWFELLFKAGLEIASQGSLVGTPLLYITQKLTAKGDLGEDDYGNVGVGEIWKPVPDGGADFFFLQYSDDGRRLRLHVYQVKVGTSRVSYNRVPGPGNLSKPEIKSNLRQHALAIRDKLAAHCLPCKPSGVLEPEMTLGLVITNPLTRPFRHKWTQGDPDEHTYVLHAEDDVRAHFLPPQLTALVQPWTPDWLKPAPRA
jgi:hypothetical protein